MKHKISYAISGLLIVIIGVQAYTHTNTSRRINALETELESDSKPRSNQSMDTPFTKNQDPFDWIAQDPFFNDTLDPVQQIQENIERLFNLHPGATAPFGNNSFLQSNMQTPDINVENKSDKIVVEVSPIDPEKQDVEVDLEDQQLTLTFKTKVITDETDNSDSGRVYRHSQSSHQYTRSIDLEEPLDVSTLITDAQGSVLKITIQKRV